LLPPSGGGAVARARIDRLHGGARLLVVDPHAAHW
jgi:hypothetical protein